MTGHYDRHGNFEAWQPAGAKHRIKRSYPVNGYAPATDAEAQALLDAAARAAAKQQDTVASDVRDADPVVEVVAGVALFALVGGFALAALAALVRYVWGVL